ncbi:ABC transporter substrate-binding protein [Stappia sp.]|uniref:ABC transporter substrate-binding protein n=1 Tax=Stappia sp. TaxID=1870903 RepID=UPI003A9A0EC2
MMILRKNAGLLLAGVLMTLSMPALAGPDDNSLTWSGAKEVAAVDPYYDTSREAIVLAQHVYDGLVYWNQETETFEPLLAKSFRQVDPTTWEFELRDDVKFHDGSSFGPEDVVYTFNFITDQANGVLNYGDIRWLKGAEQTGDHTIRLHLNEPFPAILSNLALVLPILPAGHFDAAETASDGSKRYAAVKPVGTGPYRVAELSQGDTVVMEVNPDYFADSPKGTPKIETITYRTVSDASAQVAELMTGGIDWIWGLSNDQAAALAAAPQITSVNAPTMRISYLTFDLKGTSGTDAFTKLDVRRAVAHAIDRGRIAKFLMGENSEVVNAACHPVQFGCTNDVMSYDYSPEKAKELLEKAGYSGDIEVNMVGYRDREVTEAIMGDLSKVGIKSNLRWMKYAAARELIVDGKAQVANMTWGSSSIPDVSAITSYFFGGGPDDPANDEQVQASIRKGDLSSDPDERRAAYKEALQRIAEEVYWLPLFTYTKNYSFNSQLDFAPTADELPKFYATSWK